MHAAPQFLLLLFDRLGLRPLAFLLFLLGVETEWAFAVSCNQKLEGKLDVQLDLVCHLAELLVAKRIELIHHSVSLQISEFLDVLLTDHAALLVHHWRHCVLLLLLIHLRIFTWVVGVVHVELLLVKDHRSWLLHWVLRRARMHHLLIEKLLDLLASLASSLPWRLWLIELFGCDLDFNALRCRFRLCQHVLFALTFLHLAATSLLQRIFIPLGQLQNKTRLFIHVVLLLKQKLDLSLRDVELDRLAVILVCFCVLNQVLLHGVVLVLFRVVATPK